MAAVTYDGAACPASPGESVRETLLRNGVPISNCCRADACQACLLRASAGTLPEQSQQGLKETLARQGYFLSCLCRPEGDLTIEPPGGLDMPATIASLERLSPTVLRARIRPTKDFAYRPGQFITLRRDDGLARSYSLANLPDEETLELHIRRAPRGRMSGWLFPGKPEQPLLLVGTGTGLAPVAGICKDAISHGHTGTIHIFHGALNPEGLYLQDELSSLARSPSKCNL